MSVTTDPKSDSFPWRPTERTVHLCLDMQRMFSADGPWPTPWLERILPSIVAIAERCPEQTIFTRFVPPKRADLAHGTWRAYYQRWSQTTLDVIDPDLIELLPPLDQFTPPAQVLDKTVYSAFVGTDLARSLVARQADGLIITGAETDVCVLATVLDAVDLGYPVFLITDAVCGSTDRSHDAVLTLYRTRFFQQVQTLLAEHLLSQWP